MRGGVYTLSAAALVLAALLSAGCSGRDADAPPPPPARTNNVLLLVTTTDTRPYSYCDDETGEIVGLEIDIARAAAAKLGCKLEIRKEKFPNLLTMVSAGEADMAASGITITEGRLQTVDFTVPYATEGGMFLYRAGEEMPTMIRAEKIRIGTMDASTYDFYLTSHGLDPVRYGSYVDAMDDLRAKRLDAMFFDSCAVRIDAENSNGEFAASRLETRENFGIAVRKGDTRLKKALDMVITAGKRRRRRW
ncbi:MAG: amino acid ABC transporter substrate-binding protein [Kiritimatiellae bacterium]|nr:amino acid ABC transporter substrate-binding protein [Kiritimatiellia bacterium]